MSMHGSEDQRYRETAASSNRLHGLCGSWRWNRISLTTHVPSKLESCPLCKLSEFSICYSLMSYTLWIFLRLCILCAALPSVLVSVATAHTTKVTDTCEFLCPWFDSRVEYAFSMDRMGGRKKGLHEAVNKKDPKTLHFRSYTM